MSQKRRGQIELHSVQHLFTERALLYGRAEALEFAPEPVGHGEDILASADREVEQDKRSFDQNICTGYTYAGSPETLSERHTRSSRYRISDRQSFLSISSFSLTCSMTHEGIETALANRSMKASWCSSMYLRISAGAGILSCLNLPVLL